MLLTLTFTFLTWEAGTVVVLMPYQGSLSVQASGSVKCLQSARSVQMMMLITKGDSLSVSKSTSYIDYNCSAQELSSET